MVTERRKSLLRYVLHSSGIAQSPQFRIPDRADLPTPDDLFRLDLEGIGEIAARSDFQIKTHCGGAVIDDVEILMHAAIDGAADHERECPECNRTALRQEIVIGEKDARGVVGDRATVQ